MTDLKTTMQVAEHFGVSRQAVHLWRLGGLEHVQLGKQTILYDLDEVLSWLEVNRPHHRWDKR